MTADERAIEALAGALRSAAYAFPVDEKRAYGFPEEARRVWSRIDKAALRAALLDEVRREIEALPYGKVYGPDIHKPTDGVTLFVDADEWAELLDRDDVLRILGGSDDG